MTRYAQRSPEERALLNPSFCALLLWLAARGHIGEDSVPLSFEEAFLVLPLVLHRATRETLPTKISSSLASWVEENPLQRSRVAETANTLVPFTKDALQFGGQFGFLALNVTAVSANVDWEKQVTATLKSGSAEVQVCAKKAEYVGRWFARAGTPPTVFALLGVRP